MSYTRDALGEHSARSRPEADADATLRSHLEGFPGLAGAQWNHHLITLLKRHSLMRILHFDHLYRQQLAIPGVILEFGVQFGSSLALLTNFRAIYEPYNASRLIFGFDTFAGIEGASDEKDAEGLDGTHLVPPNYEVVLAQVLEAHEQLAPLAHLSRTRLYKGDAREQVERWCADYPGMPISMLHLDMDVYDPTVAVLEALEPRLVAGSILVFDELTAPFFPGEARAVLDTFGFNALRLERSPMQPYSAWVRYERRS